MGGSRSEIECALMADAYLDGIGDKKRKRNRDDFPEVREAFVAKVEAKALIAGMDEAKEPDAGGSK